jgi:hypothetical protein
MIGARTERTLTVRTLGQETTVDRADVVKQEQLPVSLMPEQYGRPASLSISAWPEAALT